MGAATPFLILNQAWTDAVPWVERRLRNAGLQVKQTFDLQVARHAQKNCPCPHHGTDQCNCQMLVLLVYRNPGVPLTLTIHGHDESTWLFLVYLPERRAEPNFESFLRCLLAPTFPAISSGPAYETRSTS